MISSISQLFTIFDWNTEGLAGSFQKFYYEWRLVLYACFMNIAKFTPE